MTLRYTLAAAIVLAATPADAQEATPLDSSATDTIAFARWRGMTDSVKTVITAHRDTISARLDSATVLLRRKSRPTRTKRSEAHWAKPTGSIEAGGSYGAVPFALDNGNPWNAYAKGRLGLDVLGAPLSVSFDLGTDLPIRGQRNKISIGFDPSRAAINSRWADAQQLHAAQAKLDSLETQQAQAQRSVDGAKARLTAELARYATEKAKQALLLAKDSARTLAPEDGNGPAQIPAAVQAGEQARSAALDNLHSAEQVRKHASPDSSARKAGAYKDRFDSATASATEQQRRIDSLTQTVNVQEAKLREVQERVTDARRITDRSKALTRKGMERAPLAQRIAQGLRRFEIGSCTPEGSEFLINGTTLQGVSFTYARNDLFVAFDHGRTMDDAALDAVAHAGRLRQLHQSLFLNDASELNPRKLSDLRVGYGTPEGTHAHVGLLRGTRLDHPAGSVEQADASFVLRNLVAEIDAGVEVAKGHATRVIYARSSTGPLHATAADGAHQTGTGLFEGDARAEAIKARWSSEFRRLGTRITAEGRRITPAFQSYGVGFLRAGSRAGELRIDQRIGERWRIRANGLLEERTALTTETPRVMLLRRGQVGVQAKLLRTITGHASYAPVLATWANGNGPDMLSRNYIVGATLRERWRGTVLTINSTSSYYQWASAGAHGSAWNQNATANLSLGPKWSLGGQWMMLQPAQNDTLASVTNIGAQASYRSTKGFTADAMMQWPDTGAPAYLIEVRQPLRKGMAIGARTQRFANYPQVQGGDALAPVASDQAHTLFITLQW